MPTYHYRAMNTALSSAAAEGSLEAANRAEAFRQLEERGLQVVRLEEQAGAKSGNKGAGAGFSLSFGSKPKRVPFSALENFTRQLSSLLAAGVPLARALSILAREAAQPAARAKWKEIHDLVIDGTPLADAMARSPETFPAVYTAMVQAGETGGFLDVVLAHIAEFQTRERDIKGRIRSAMIYPVVLLFLVVAVLIFLLVFFIPRFQTIFAGFGAALPLLTRMIVAASHAATHYGFFVAAAIGVAIYSFVRWRRTDAGARAWERFILRLPVIGPLSARFAMTRFCRMLGTLVGAGVPLIQALRVARESIGNQTLIDAVGNSIDRVKKGDALAVSLADCAKLFPASMIEMVAVSEETGKLDQELVRLATVTENELDRQLRTTVALAEPLMLFVMAGIIGTIFIGMVYPIFTIQDYIK